MPLRLQRHRRKGWRLPANAVCVTRPGRWGNPFPVETCGRDMALWLFQVYARQRLAVEPDWLAPVRGQDLACVCRLEDTCHADLLLRLANDL